MAPDEDGPAPPAVQDEDVALPEGAEPSPEERRVVGQPPRRRRERGAPRPHPRGAQLHALRPLQQGRPHADRRLPRQASGRSSRPSAPLVLEVHPFELVLGREVVYLEKDRERSLSFRLFRDGVRRIGFAARDDLGGDAAAAPDPLDPLHRGPAAGGRPGHAAAQGRLRPRPGRRDRGIRPRGGARGADPIGDLLRGATRALRGPGAVGPAAAVVPGGRPAAAPAGGAGAARAACARRRPRRRCRGRRCGRSPSCSTRPVRTTSRPCSASPSRCGSSCSSSSASTRWSSSAASCARPSPRRRRRRRVPRLLARRAHARDPGAVAAAPTRGGPGPARWSSSTPPPAATLDQLVDLLTEEGDGPRAPLLRRLVVRGFRTRPGGARRPPARGARGTARGDAPAPPRGRGRAGRTARRDRGLDGEGRRGVAARGAPPARRRRRSPPRRRARSTTSWSRGSSRCGVATLPVMASRGGAARLPRPAGARGEARGRAAPPPRPRPLGRALAHASARSALALFGSWLTPKAGGPSRPAGEDATRRPPLQRVALAGLREMRRERRRTSSSELLAAHGEAVACGRRRRPRSRRGLAAREAQWLRRRCSGRRRTISSGRRRALARALGPRAPRRGPCARQPGARARRAPRAPPGRPPAHDPPALARQQRLQQAGRGPAP